MFRSTTWYFVGSNKYLRDLHQNRYAYSHGFSKYIYQVWKHLPMWLSRYCTNAVTDHWLSFAPHKSNMFLFDVGLIQYLVCLPLALWIAWSCLGMFLMSWQYNSTGILYHLHYMPVVNRYRFESFLECWDEDDFANAEFIEFERERFHTQYGPLEQHLDALGSLLRVFRHELLEVATNPGSLVVASQLYCVEISGSEVSGEEDLSFWDR